MCTRKADVITQNACHFLFVYCLLYNYYILPFLCLPSFHLYSPSSFLSFHFCHSILIYFFQSYFLLYFVTIFLYVPSLSSLFSPIFFEHSLTLITILFSFRFRLYFLPFLCELYFCHIIPSFPFHVSPSLFLHFLLQYFPLILFPLSLFSFTFLT